MNLSNNAFLLGKRSDVKDILAISDLCALTSYVEGFPNVLLEAMASKVPCIATNVGEIKTIIGKKGFIANPGDIETISNFLEDFFNYPEIKRTQLMNESYEQVKNNFDLNIIRNKLINIYVQ